MDDLIYRRAEYSDLKDIVSLLVDDVLGSTRESGDLTVYEEALNSIISDSNQYLMVVELKKKIVGTCHLTIIPSLTFNASKRLQIEAVRVHKSCRGEGIGQLMIKKAMDYAVSQNALIIQLTTNKQRPKAIEFYKKLGFETTHEGMKLYKNK